MSVLAFAEVVAPAVLLTSTLRLEGVVVFTDAYLSPTWIEHHMYTVHSITHISISNHVPRSMLAVEEVVATAVSSTSTLEVAVVVTDAHVSPSSWIEHHMYTVHSITHISISNHVPRSMLAVEEVVATAVSSTSTLEVVVVVTDAHVSPSSWIEHHMHTVHTYVHKHFKSCTQLHAFFSCGGIRFHFVCID